MLVKPIRRLSGFGVGLCKCGHLEGDHSNLRIPFDAQDGKAWLDHNQGGCCAGQCKCKQFTFVRWATLEEVAEMLHARHAECV